MQQFDALLSQHVGDFGRAQLLVLLAASASWATLACAVLAMVFVTHTPRWECTSASDDACAQLMQRSRGPGATAALCALQPQQRRWEAESARSSLVPEFSLVCGGAWKVSLANACFFVGYAVGSCLFGWLADTRGRRAALVASNLAAAASALACAASPSFAAYVGARTALGVACAGLPIAAYVLATESVGPPVRGRAGTLSQLTYHAGEWLLPAAALGLQSWRGLYGAVAALALATAALAAAAPESPRWQLARGQAGAAARTLSWMAAANGRPAVDWAVLVCAGADSADGAGERTRSSSPRDTTAATDSSSSGCLIHDAAPTHVHDCSSSLGQCRAVFTCKGTDAQQDVGVDGSCGVALLPSSGAVVSSRDAASLAGKRAGTTQQQQQAQQREQQQQRCRLRAAQPGAACHDSTWMVFTDALLARCFWVSALLCCVMALTFFTASLATELLQGSLYANFVLTSLGELPATLLGAVAVDVWGRRRTVACGLLASGAACVACASLPAGGLSTAAAMLGKAACSGAWSLAYMWAAELMPTTIRSAALAGTNQAARLGGVTAPWVVLLGGRVGHSKLPLALVGAAALLGLAATPLLPETLGQPQPDSLAHMRELYSSRACSHDAKGLPGVSRQPYLPITSRARSYQLSELQGCDARVRGKAAVTTTIGAAHYSGGSSRICSLFT